MDAIVITANSKAGLALCGGAVLALMDSGVLEKCKTIIGVGYGNFIVAELVAEMSTICPVEAAYSCEEKSLEMIPLQHDADPRWTIMCRTKRQQVEARIRVLCETNYEAIAMQSLYYWFTGVPLDIHRSILPHACAITRKDLPYTPNIILTASAGSEESQTFLSFSKYDDHCVASIPGHASLAEFACASALPEEFGSRKVSFPGGQSLSLRPAYPVSPCALWLLRRIFKKSLSSVLLVDCLPPDDDKRDSISPCFVHEICRKRECTIFELMGGKRLSLMSMPGTMRVGIIPLVHKLGTVKPGMTSLQDLTSPAIAYGYIEALVYAIKELGKELRDPVIPIDDDFDDYGLLSHYHYHRSDL